jgi:hypothetical protein
MLGRDRKATTTPVVAATNKNTAQDTDDRCKIVPDSWNITTKGFLCSHLTVLSSIRKCILGVF